VLFICIVCRELDCVFVWSTICKNAESGSVVFENSGSSQWSIEKHFPLQHKLRIHKIFNRNTLKISYSCMNNVKSIITKHNAHIIIGTVNHWIRKLTTVTATTKPLVTLAHYRNNVWLTTLFTKPQSQRTTRTTLNTTLVWQRLHLRNVTLITLHLSVIKKDSNKTELSNHIWKLKENNQDYTIKWSILKHAISYTGGSKRSNLCLEEKFCILKDINKDNLLNKRSEIFGKCHKNRF
jgi:hypothetical protein